VQKNLKNFFKNDSILDQVMNKKLIKEVKIADNTLGEWYN
jgi:hypothetical protein